MADAVNWTSAKWQALSYAVERIRQ